MNNPVLLNSEPLVDDRPSPEHHIFEVNHQDVIFENERYLRFLKMDARVDEDQYHSIDLAEYWLPPTAVHSKPQRLTSRQDLVAVTVSVIDKYHHRVKRSKSRHRRAANIVATLSKFFEYLWLNDIYKLDSVTPEDFEKLARLLGQGNWHKALEFDRRLELSFNAPDRALVTSILGIPRYLRRSLLGDEVRKAIGSNLSSNEASQNLQAIYDVLEEDGVTTAQCIELEKADSSGMGESILRQTFDALNYLLDLPFNLGLRFEPYPDGYKFSKTLGRPGSRTKNLGALEAGLLLNEAYQWLYIYGPLVSDLVADACSQVRAAHADGREVLGHNLAEWLESSPIRITLEGHLGLPIENLDGGNPSTFSLRRLLMCTFTACFVLTAVMNARRRDEITHRKFGLHRGCVQVLDEELGIFTGLFFIEKTHQTYLDFYVNKTTWHAVQLLEKIQASFDELAMAMGRPVLDDFPEKERSLFGYFRLSRIKGIGKNRCWYEFDAKPNGGQAAYFLRRALGDAYSLGPQAHMFRRLYALVFMYQHEIPSLQALSQQFGHDNLTTTEIYVTDPALRDEAERIEMKMEHLASRRSKVFAAHLKGIRREMEIVSDEKLLETILHIISNDQTSGGYPNFIKRFYRKISGRLDFKNLDLAAQAKTVKEIVKARGHAPKPMRHGQCMVGTATPARGAHCRSSDGLVQTKNASPSTCGRCQFHFLSRPYLMNLETDLRDLEGIASDNRVTAFEKERARIDSENLRMIISYHRTRLV